MLFNIFLVGLHFVPGFWYPQFGAVANALFEHRAHFFLSVKVSCTDVFAFNLIRFLFWWCWFLCASVCDCARSASFHLFYLWFKSVENVCKHRAIHLRTHIRTHTRTHTNSVETRHKAHAVVWICKCSHGHWINAEDKYIAIAIVNPQYISMCANLQIK